MGERHKRLWEWFESLEEGKTLAPRLEVWPRGGAKSSTGELGTAYVGSKLSRRFVLYLCGTQDRADEHVQAISGHLERLGHSPLLNKQGNSKGWRRNQLRTAHGFNVAALGLDTAVRGIKLDQFRPDLIILDDVDSREDTPEKTAKKERAITEGILPAGAAATAILFLQNLIIEDGIVARMVDGRAEYLRNADILGPEPAIRNLVTEDDRLENGRGYKRIVSGEPTWAGQSLEICQRQIIDWGWTAFKRESQHEVYGADGYFFDASRLLEVDDVPRLNKRCRAWDLAGTEGGGDYTRGTLGGTSANQNLYIEDLVGGQLGSDRARALMVATAKADQEKYGSVIIRITQDPGQAGADQAQQLERLLKPYGTVVVKTATGSKAVRARGFADHLNSGNVFMRRAEWNHTMREEVRKFREDEQHDFDDIVDTLSDIYNTLITPQGVRQVRLNY